MAPIDDAVVFMTTGGSDAIETAAKLIRRYWNAVGKPEKRTIVIGQHPASVLHLCFACVPGLMSRTGTD